MKYSFALSAASLATVAMGANHAVTVGPGLMYSPDTVTASPGDTVSFHFGAGHNVVSGSFNSPCQPNGLIYSGSPQNGDIFTITVNNTNPIWIYCSVPHHCESGMAMVVNAPSNATISQYKQAAASVSSSNTPATIAGGVFGAVSSSASSSGTSSSASSGAASTATSSAGDTASSTSSSSSSSSTGKSGASSLAVSSFGASAAVLAVALGLTL